MKGCNQVWTKEGEMDFTFFIKVRCFCLAIVLLFSLTSFSQSESDDEKYNTHYTIDDRELSRIPIGFASPTDLLLENSQETSPQLDLTRWVSHQGDLPTPNEKYDRKKHFGGWVTDAFGDCQNTRAKVLIRDSKVEVTYTNSQKCTVLAGEWNDPYTGKTYTSARDIQIDHLVPLKHAYDSGAWKWSDKKRCLYGNFDFNDFHLLSVDGPENMKKGARSPDQYMPPNEKYSCQYLQQWLMVKAIWALPLNAGEAKGVNELIKEHNCSNSEMQSQLVFLKKQRTQIMNQNQKCL